jgi:hypothetical protein
MFAAWSAFLLDATVLLVLQFTAVLATVILFFRFSLAARSPTKTTIDTTDELELYTPNTIDALALKAGVECDPAFLAETDMVNIAHPGMTGAAVGKGSCPFAGKEMYQYQQALVYFRQFLAKGHEHLGRGGPVCPFVPLALKKNSIHMGVVRAPYITARSEGKYCPGRRGETTAEQVRQVARSFIERFFELEPRSGKLAVYKAVLLIFPDVPIERAHEIIDAVQVELKPEFVRRGLMLGEFHTQNNVPGLHNDSFYPLRTPTPCFAIRYIVPSDLVFLDMSRYPEDVREQFLRAYLMRFGDAGTAGDAADGSSGGLSAKDRPMIVKARLALSQIDARKSAALA